MKAKSVNILKVGIKQITYSY